MVLYSESQVVRNRGATHSTIGDKPSIMSLYKKLFSTKKYTMMFLCDTVGFFSYMIIFQVIHCIVLILEERSFLSHLKFYLLI